jgi:regulator of replication initiation timing
MELLLQQGEHIKELIQVIKLHGENVSIQLESEKTSKRVSNPTTYMECEYAALPYPRPVFYHPTDPMMYVKECGHAFRKEHFLQWIKSHDTCMECSALL